MSEEIKDKKNRQIKGCFPENRGFPGCLSKGIDSPLHLAEAAGVLKLYIMALALSGPIIAELGIMGVRENLTEGIFLRPQNRLPGAGSEVY